MSSITPLRTFRSLFEKDPFQKSSIDNVEDDKLSIFAKALQNPDNSLNSSRDLSLSQVSTSKNPSNSDNETYQELFFKQLAENILNLLYDSHQQNWQQLENEELPPSFFPAIERIGNALTQIHSETKNLKNFIKGIYNFTELCGDEKQYANAKKVALEMISTYHIGINALSIHKDIVQTYTSSLDKPIESDIEELFLEVASLDRPSIVTELGNMWGLCNVMTKYIGRNIRNNLPNQLFKIKVQEENNSITFFRMQSPAAIFSDSLCPLYELFLDHHKMNSSKHMSLITLSPSFVSNEEKMVDIRYKAQDSRKENLLAWAFDPDSDFAAQYIGEEPEEEEESDSFMVKLYDHLTKGENPAFRFPKDSLENENFIKNVKPTINEVKRIFFPDHKILNPIEKRDYILLTVIFMMEHFCEHYQPLTVETACRSHIDRGIMVSSVLYVYLMIKSGNQESSEFIEYLKPFILAPALVAENRPPHQPRMTVILSLITRMLQPSVIEKIQKSKTYFTNCELEIPKATL